MRLSASAAAFLFCVLAGAPAAAQSFETLAPGVRELVSVPDPVIALTNVRVIDGTGAAPREAALARFDRVWAVSAASRQAPTSPGDDRNRASRRSSSATPRRSPPSTRRSSSMYAE